MTARETWKEEFIARLVEAGYTTGPALAAFDRAYGNSRIDTSVNPQEAADAWIAEHPPGRRVTPGLHELSHSAWSDARRCLEACERIARDYPDDPAAAAALATARVAFRSAGAVRTAVWLG